MDYLVFLIAPVSFFVPLFGVFVFYSWREKKCDKKLDENESNVKEMSDHVGVQIRGE